jgi:hypothetical protein
VIISKEDHETVLSALREASDSCYKREGYVKESVEEMGRYDDLAARLIASETS